MPNLKRPRTTDDRIEFSSLPEKRIDRRNNWPTVQDYQREHLRHATAENSGISFIPESLNANALLPTDSIFDNTSLAVQNRHPFDNIVRNTCEASFHSSVQDFDFDISSMGKHGQNPFDEVAFPVPNGYLSMESERPSEVDASFVCFGAVCNRLLHS
jgi:hypothetical protein